MLSHACVFRAKDGSGPVPVTIGLWEDGAKVLDAHGDWIRAVCRARRAALCLDLSGEGMMEQRDFSRYYSSRGFYGALYKLGDDLHWLDDSLVALRVFELLRTLDAVKEMDGLTEEAVGIYTEGRFSVYGDLAAFLDGRITSLRERDGLESYEAVVRDRFYDSRDIASVTLPGLLQLMDLNGLRDASGVSVIRETAE